MTSIRYDVSRPDGTFEARWWSPVDTAMLGEQVYEWDLVSDCLTANERFGEMTGIGPEKPAVGTRILAHCVHLNDRARSDSDLASDERDVVWPVCL